MSDLTDQLLSAPHWHESSDFARAKRSPPFLPGRDSDGQIKMAPVGRGCCWRGSLCNRACYPLCEALFDRGGQVFPPPVEIDDLGVDEPSSGILLQEVHRGVEAPAYLLLEVLLRRSYPTYRQDREDKLKAGNSHTSQTLFLYGMFTPARPPPSSRKLVPDALATCAVAPNRVTRWDGGSLPSRARTGTRSAQ